MELNGKNGFEHKSMYCTQLNYILAGLKYKTCYEIKSIDYIVILYFWYCLNTEHGETTIISQNQLFEFSLWFYIIK